MYLDVATKTELLCYFDKESDVDTSVQLNTHLVVCISCVVGM